MVGKTHTEDMLVEAMRASQSDLNAFTPIYEAYVDRIYSYCLYRVRSEEDAEDLTSQVFARAMSRSHTYNGGKVGAWLFRIAYHITVDHFRVKRPDPLSEAHLSVLVDERQQSPLQAVIHKEQVQQLEQLLLTLSEEKRNLLLLRITGDLTSDEVGEVVGKSGAGVRVEIHRIIQKLKQHVLLNS